jgi:hypothetical protein
MTATIQPHTRLRVNGFIRLVTARSMSGGLIPAVLIPKISFSHWRNDL